MTPTIPAETSAQAPQADQAARAPVSETNYNRVREAIRQDILAGILPAGSRLKLAALTRRYGLSPAPIREALNQLAVEGIVVIEPNKGAAVRGIDETLIRELYEIRMGLESFLTGLGAEAASPGDARRLAAILDRHEAAVAAGDRAAAMAFNTEFHSSIYRIRPNEQALRLLDSHATLVRTIQNSCGISEGRMREVMFEHRALLDAVAARDAAGAERIMRAHVQGALVDLIEQLRSGATRPG